MKQKLFSLCLAALCLVLPVLRVGAAVYYVNASNAAPVAPFTNWVTAATNIQDAINLTSGGDTVLVTNGVYAGGGLVMVGNLTNRVALTNAITVQSVNGPWVTTILGAGATNGTAAVRCAWLTNGAALIGFTLQGGATQTSGDTTSLESGGGAWCASSNALVANCVINSNTADFYGGAIYRGTVKNSLISSNGCMYSSGGAVYQAVLNNCTIVSNTIYGVVNCMAMTNCIIYFNGLNGSQNCSVSGNAFSHCCTTPGLSGTANFTSAPQLMADGAHLAANSPCIGAGLSLITGTDIFGNAWSNPPAVGCAEWYPAPVPISPPTTQFQAAGAVAVGVNVAGQPPFACWWTLNGVPLQNNGHYSAANTTALLISSMSLSDAGGYQVVVSNAFGMATSVVSQVTIHCVASGGMAVPPYTNWSTAATNIQDAINVAQAGDIVLVTNGVYAFGGLAMEGNLTNRVALTQAIMVQSVNGPWATTIFGAGATNGNGAVRCAWLTNGAVLAGFALTGGATRTCCDTYGLESGGGVWCSSTNAMVADCLIYSNTAYEYGGGAYQGTLANCGINANNAQWGGGAYSAYLLNCTVTANSATVTTGGAYSGGCTNCILYNNTGGNYSGAGLSYCCTYPLPSRGVGNFTNAPQLFVDNVHLLTNSPCIGAGINWGFSTDINGWPWYNPPSLGCSETSAFPIVAQPVLQHTNNPAGFFITAPFLGAGPMSLWWLQNGIPLQNNGIFSSTQTAVLGAAGIGYAAAGNYQLVVSNAFGVVTSAVVTLVIHCVNVTGANPVAPYLNWGTAATNIQDAVAASAAKDVVLVTNGLYASGGKSMDGVITNRVSLDKVILLQSVNGAKVTTIQGAWDPTATNGPGAVRCAWMTNNAILCGFTLCDGATRAAATANSLNGGGVFGTSTSATVCNSVIATNFAYYSGGGAYLATLVNCTVMWNHAVGSGKPGMGAAGAGSGGGAESCNLTNCMVSYNFADQSSGGGADYCNLQNCALVGNSSYLSGGAANQGSLVNCTVSANTSSGYSSGYGAAVYGATLYNCIVSGNFSRTSYPNTNYGSCGLAYCCADPLPAGTGNLDVNPQLLADGIHLAATSPCLGAGTASVVYGTDIDGQPWNSPPSIGCDEWWPAPVVAIQPNFQVNSITRSLNCNVVVAGQTPLAYFWSKNGVPIQDDGHFSNSSTASLLVNNFALGDGGSYQVVVTNSSGAVTSSVAQMGIHAVNAAGTNPVAPFSSWATAATSIQDAINSAAAGDIVLVTNGLYATGGLAVTGNLTNRMAVNQPLTVMSVNGYAATIIQGAWDPITTNGPGAVRCAFLADGAVLNGFTLRNGATRANSHGSGGEPLESGGGIFCNSNRGIVYNCVLSNNSAIYGGGITYGLLNNSLVYGNQATYGGGAYDAGLNNCTVVNNYAILEGGGTYSTGGKNNIIEGVPKVILSFCNLLRKTAFFGAGLLFVV